MGDALLAVSTQDVVEALVREYLVKRNLTKTLDAFNQEVPKHENSITKRGTLRKVLALDRAEAKHKSKHIGQELPPTLELWTSYQMQKHNNFFEGMQPAAAAQAPRTDRVSSRQALEEEPEEASVPEGPPAGMGSTFGRRRPGSATAPPPVAGDRPSGGAMMGGFMSQPPAAASGSPAALGAATRRMAGMDLNEPDSGSSPLSGGTRPGAAGFGSSRADTGGGFTRDLAGSGVAGAGARSSPVPSAPRPPVGGMASPSPPPAAAARPVPPPAAARRPGGPARSFGAAQGNEMVMEDVDDLDLDLGDDASPMPMGRGVGSAQGTPVRAGAPGGMSGGTPLPPDTARALKQLLWGNHGQPPASWKQGFFFNARPGLQFGLVQKEGGPCGLLAGVQAHILAALARTGGGFNLSPSPAEQRAALVAALAEAVWAARKGAVATWATAVPEAGVAPGSLGYDQVMRAVVTHSAPSKEALQDVIRGTLGAYMEESGWGLVLALSSLVLSRGVAGVRGDMDEPNGALMGAHGYCTQELVNLVVTGEAVSNVFDGVRDLDGHALRGITRRCRLGVLTLFEWYKYVEVGSSLKTPDLPVWVVCSESHFTVLFSQDASCLRAGQGGGAQPFDLLYYDELANQEALIRLTVASDPKGGWTARVGDTIGDRGKCEGQNIPPLECVIETRWPGVKVNWNGTEPIL